MSTISADVSIQDIDAAADALFTCLDTDKNDIIDGLEALATLVSKIDLQRPVRTSPSSGFMESRSSMSS